MQRVFQAIHVFARKAKQRRNFQDPRNTLDLAVSTSGNTVLRSVTSWDRFGSRMWDCRSSLSRTSANARGCEVNTGSKIAVLMIGTTFSLGP